MHELLYHVAVTVWREPNEYGRWEKNVTASAAPPKLNRKEKYRSTYLIPLRRQIYEAFDIADMLDDGNVDLGDDVVVIGEW